MPQSLTAPIVQAQPCTFYVGGAKTRELMARDPRTQIMEEVYIPIPGATAGATTSTMRDYLSYGRAIVGDMARALGVEGHRK